MDGLVGASQIGGNVVLFQDTRFLLRVWLSAYLPAVCGSAATRLGARGGFPSWASGEAAAGGNLPSPWQLPPAVSSRQFE